MVDKGRTVPVFSQCRTVILLCITYIDINVNLKLLRAHANDFFVLFLRFKDEADVMYFEVIQDHGENEIFIMTSSLCSFHRVVVRTQDHSVILD